MASASSLPLVDSLVSPLAPLLNGTEIALGALKEEIDAEKCELLGPFALAVQAVMGIVVLGSLLLKRAQEKPKRKWKVWLGDVGKQITGQAFVHSSNVAISDLIARHKLDNPCSLYALNIFVDTTLGVLIVYAFLRLSTFILHHYSPTYKTGYYGNPFQFVFWARQAAVYVACLTMMKIVVLLLFWAFPILFLFANWCLSFLETDEAQVVAVMLVFPIIMNLFQFLIIDSILRSKETPNGGGGLEGTMEGDSSYLGDEERGFLQDHDDDDEEDEGEDSEDEEGSKRRKRATCVGDSGYDTSFGGARRMDDPKKGKSIREPESGVGKHDSGIGTPTDLIDHPRRNPTTSPPRGSNPRNEPIHAYPPTTPTSTNPVPGFRSKRVLTSTPPPPISSRATTPRIVVDTPKNYRNGSVIVVPPPALALKNDDDEEEDNDGWGDNSSISSSISDEAAFKTPLGEEELDEQRGGGGPRAFESSNPYSTSLDEKKQLDESSSSMMMRQVDEMLLGEQHHDDEKEEDDARVAQNIWSEKVGLEDHYDDRNRIPKSITSTTTIEDEIDVDVDEWGL